MKKFAFIMTIVLIFVLSISSGFASASISLNKTKAEPGDSITISGTAQPGTSIIVKITDEEGNIVFFDAATTDASGGYSVVFVVPDDMTADKLTVTVGSGTDVATANITIVYPATPTASSAPTVSPTATPAASPASTASPTATPTASPTLTASPTATATPSAQPADTAAPAPAVSPSAAIITPATVLQDDQAGTVTIGINVSDLPDGTYAIEMPDGTIVYVKDAVDGVLTIEAAQSDIDSVGEIELTALGDDMAPLAGVHVQVSSVAEAGTRGASTVLWWIIGGAAVLAAVLLILILLAKKKNRRKNEI